MASLQIIFLIFLSKSEHLFCISAAKQDDTNAYIHLHPDKNSRSLHYVIPSDLTATVVRSLHSLHSQSQCCLWTQRPRKCNPACRFFFLSGMIRNIIMIKLAGGEELSGSREAWQKANKRLEYCQRVVNKLHEGAEVCECLNSSVQCVQILARLVCVRLYTKMNSCAYIC